MSQSSQVPPVTVEEALRLFSEVQQLAVRDAQDSERFNAATPSQQQNQHQLHQSNQSKNSGRKASSGGNNRSSNENIPSSGFPNSSEAQLRRQLELSEAVMKKLHAKNKALSQELEEVKSRGGSSGGNSNNNNNNNAEVSQLKKKVAEQDAFIRQIQSSASKSSSTALSNSSTSINNATTTSAAGGGGGGGGGINEFERQQVRLLQKRITQLQQQFDSLVDVKLECIREGESTGRVNKEVKAFFVQSRQKMLDDAAFHETERGLLNERLAKLEMEVVHLRTKAKAAF